MHGKRYNAYNNTPILVSTIFFCVQNLFCYFSHKLCLILPKKIWTKAKFWEAEYWDLLDKPKYLNDNNSTNGEECPEGYLAERLQCGVVRYVRMDDADDNPVRGINCVVQINGIVAGVRHNVVLNRRPRVTPTGQSTAHVQLTD